MLDDSDIICVCYVSADSALAIGLPHHCTDCADKISRPPSIPFVHVEWTQNLSPDRKIESTENSCWPLTAGLFSNRAFCGFNRRTFYSFNYESIRRPRHMRQAMEPPDTTGDYNMRIAVTVIGCRRRRVHCTLRGPSNQYDLPTIKSN